MFYYEVAPTKIFRAGSDFLTYHYEEQLPIGTLVLIPVGKKTIPGLVLKKVVQPPFPTKPITKPLYSDPLPPHLLKSLLWLSDYYFTPLPTVLQTALPRGVEKVRRKTQNLQTFATRERVEEGLLAPISSPGAAPPTAREDSPARETTTGSKASKILLNPAQLNAISKINSSQKRTLLLHGITGSGKTNVYIELTRQQLTKGHSVILLTPEIALTSQLVKIFQSHFQNITLLHSQLSESERHVLWEQILKNPSPQVIIGPRSALFAPVRSLGLIIIDEAHEPAYSQDQSPKYSALRLASTMGKTVLGTATPLVTDYYLASNNDALIELSELAIQSDRSAKIKIIDLKDQTSFRRHRLLSDALLASIDASLKNHTGSLLFHNRRGSAPLTICDSCGWQALCPSCLLPLTLHADKFSLICHTCGQQQKVPTSCPECKNADIIHKGFGTKHLESELTKLFPHARIARFDTDTPAELSMKNIYSEVREGAYDIIIGTQMIAKGFDLPQLTTLGVVQADSQLSLPDFGSVERTYHLLNQAIGRANRGHQNTEIFIQTYQPSHPAITTAAKGDYLTFFRHLLHERRSASLPPYAYLLKLTLTYKTEQTTTKNIQLIAKSIQNMTNQYKGIQNPANSIQISRPTPAFHERTPSGYTWQLIIKSKSRAPLLKILKNLPPNPHLHLTLDPPSLL